MVVYDAAVYIICWLVVFGLFHNINPMMVFSMVCGFGFFVSARGLFKVYLMILRNGSTATFARLFAADTLASFLIATINLLMYHFQSGDRVDFLLLLCFLATFVLISIAVRTLYCYLYRLALRNTSFSKAARRIFEIFTLVDLDTDLIGATLHFSRDHEEKLFINELQWIVDKFDIDGQTQSITQIKKGYINRTYRVETVTEDGMTHRYILQRINDNVFRDVDLLMENYRIVTEELREKLFLYENRESAVPSICPTKDGMTYHKNTSGCWRMITCFKKVYSLDIPNSKKTFEMAGYAFGSFVKAFDGFDIEKIKDSIPDFHNTKKRYEALEESVKADRIGRVKDVLEEIEFIRARTNSFGIITDALEKGEIPKRICHNDCNLNNILFDKRTDRPVAIIDLDTVMASSPLYDYGDSMRIGTNTARDDEKDLTKVSCNLAMYEHYARGYLSALGDILTERELELLPYASIVITIEDGIRFLKDHIDGDVYYSISYPGQNLDRARTQLKLVMDMEAKLPEIKNILRDIYEKLNLKAVI